MNFIKDGKSSNYLIISKYFLDIKKNRILLLASVMSFFYIDAQIRITIYSTSAVEYMHLDSKNEIRSWKKIKNEEARLFYIPKIMVVFNCF